MTFLFDRERLTAVSQDGISMGHIAYPQVRAGLVNISHVTTAPEFRGSGVEEAMMEALLTHLDGQNRKAALTAPYAQKYLRDHPRWAHILPGQICFTTY